MTEANSARHGKGSGKSLNNFLKSLILFKFLLHHPSGILAMNWILNTKKYGRHNYFLSQTKRSCFEKPTAKTLSLSVKWKWYLFQKIVIRLNILFIKLTYSMFSRISFIHWKNTQKVTRSKEYRGEGQTTGPSPMMAQGLCLVIMVPNLPRCLAKAGQIPSTPHALTPSLQNSLCLTFPTWSQLKVLL